MNTYSPYAVADSGQPQRKLGENLAAAAFVGIALFLVLDVNVGIWRLFRKRTGYYYWSMQLGTLACAVDALGVILKYLVPHSSRIWLHLDSPGRMVHLRSCTIASPLLPPSLGQ